MSGVYLRVGRMDGDWHSQMEDGLVHVWQRGGSCGHRSGMRGGYCAGCHGDGTPKAGIGALDDVTQPPGADGRTGAAIKVGIPGWVARQVLVGYVAQADMQASGGRGSEEQRPSTEDPQPIEGRVPAWKGRIGGSHQEVRQPAFAPLHQAPSQNHPAPRAKAGP